MMPNGIVLLGDVSGRPQVALSVDQDGAGDGFIGAGNNAGGLASMMDVGVTGGGFVGVPNAAGTGGATIGVDTLNVGRLTISNEAETDVIEAFAKGRNGQIDVKTSTGISI
jgi:hypothetical protein